MVIKAVLSLDLPWIPNAGSALDNLTVQRSQQSLLTFGDGTVLDVRVLDPTRYRSAPELLGAVETQQHPGRVILVAGPIPAAWRAPLRTAEISFIDTSGVVEIFWPRLRISGNRFGQYVQRRREPQPVHRGRARVMQELLVTTVDGSPASLADLAAGAQVSLSTASRVIAGLNAHGLVAKRWHGRQMEVAVVDRAGLAGSLAERTSWPRGELLHGYLWGSNIWEVAARLSANAMRAAIPCAVTGRVGAAFLGMLGTTPPMVARCWVVLDNGHLTEAAEALGVEPSPADEGNVGLAVDNGHLGTHRRASVTFNELSATVAHPIRVWCDLQSEPRGTDLATPLWELTNNAQ